MTKIADFLSAIKKLPPRVLIFMLFVLILLLSYGVGTIVFPISILSSYHNEKCSTVRSINGLYTGIYPFFLRDQSISPQVDECEAYLSAAMFEEKGEWSDAYTAYQDYLKLYPSGLHVDEAHQQSAIVLMEDANVLAAQKQFGEALTRLNLIISGYPNSSVSVDALALTPSIFVSWGAGLREAENFVEAEQVFMDYRMWIQNNPNPVHETEALDGLVQTYLDWGLSLQSEKLFEEALTKFDMAAAVDPQSLSGASSQTGSYQRRFYIAWGNELLEQGEFNAAIETFKLGVSRSDGSNEDGVSDALVNGHIQWANKAIADEDFENALEQLAAASPAAVSGEMKEAVDEALDDTYLAFSNSSGDQARRAMRAAMIAICDRNQRPDLPIFGLDKDSARFGVYGNDAQLPDDVAARTPAEMHYVACIEEGSRIVAKSSQFLGWLITPAGRTYAVLPQLDFIQMINAKQHEKGEERGKQIEADVVFGCWYERMMLENSVA